MPTISVIIPIYNVESYIQQCLESVLAQTFQNIEILCVNDCGTDNSMQIVKKYAQKDNRIKIVDLEINKGLGAARNAGLKIAGGKYIACIDSDDYVEPDMFKLSCNKLEETGFDSVWVNMKIFDDNKQYFLKDNYLSKHSEGIINITSENINHFPVNAWNKLYNLDFVKAHNVLWSDGLFYEDMEFYYRFYTKSKTLYFIDQPLYIYRVRDNSILHNDKTGKSNKREDIFKVAKNIYIYLNEEKIFDKYKNSFIEMIIQSIERSHNTEAITPAVINLLKTINFPSNFEKNDCYDFLEYFIKYSKSSNLKKFFYKCYYIFVLFLTKIIPNAKYRRKYRSKYKPYVFKTLRR
ncbi:glycosyl transferase [Endomicrobiia bacterium]|nr:glycosyl transferase [Endomicrobiia bacterium]